jgi:hypothetical protein
VTGTDDRQGDLQLFSSPAMLRGAFERRLAQLINHDVLGVFILVLANASFEPSLFDQLRDDLRRAFERWVARFASADERALGAAADDVAVFRRLQACGFDRLSTTQWRDCGPWRLQFNPLRSFRPPRMSNAVIDQPYRAFDSRAFHFNKPFLADEILWEGDIAGMPVRLLYNKFPFAETHGLLVPHPMDCRPQQLLGDDLARICAVVALLGQRLPEIGFGFNAFGAYASVNHLHFQMYNGSGGQMPIEDPSWRHNGGDRPYPLPVERHADPAAAWRTIERLQQGGWAYNLLIRPDAVYVVGRARQGSYRQSEWTGGFAWSEASGVVTLFDESAFSRLREQDITAELAVMQPR